MPDVQGTIFAVAPLPSGRYIYTEIVDTLFLKM
jgi:hypothetical protein